MNDRALREASADDSFSKSGPTLPSEYVIWTPLILCFSPAVLKLNVVTEMSLLDSFISNSELGNALVQDAESSPKLRTFFNVGLNRLPPDASHVHFSSSTTGSAGVASTSSAASSTTGVSTTSSYTSEA